MIHFSNFALTNTGDRDTRSGFGDALLELGRRNPRVFALCADLTSSLKMDKFAKEFPKRFVQTGIAEANMIGIAAGLASSGLIPFAGSFANFVTSRVYDQVRQSVSYSNKNVKICGSHAGVTLGEDGATHQVMEDIGLMKMIPGMVVINVCDYNQAYQATLEIADIDSPVYLRFGRPKVPNFTPATEPFKIGAAYMMREGDDVSILATGHMVWHALQAAEILRTYDIYAEVINIATIKPMDTNAILYTANKTKHVIVAEEHQRLGGLGETVAALLAEYLPTTMRFVSMKNTFGQSGEPMELLDYYGMGTNSIVNAATEMLRSSYSRNPRK